MPTHLLLARRLGPTCTPLQVAGLRALGRQEQPCEVWITSKALHRALGDDTQSAPAWRKLMQQLRRKGPQYGVDPDTDIHSFRWSCSLTPLACCAQLFCMLTQRQTHRQMRVRAWSLLGRLVAFGCLAATSPEMGHVRVEVLPGITCCMLVGQAGEIVGVEHVFRLFPLLQILWDSRTGKPWERDSTGSIRLASTSGNTTFIDFLLLLAFVAPGSDDVATDFWIQVGCPLCRAMLGLLARLLEAQSWRSECGGLWGGRRVGRGRGLGLRGGACGAVRAG